MNGCLPTLVIFVRAGAKEWGGGTLAVALLSSPRWSRLARWSGGGTLAVALLLSSPRWSRLAQWSGGATLAVALLLSRVRMISSMDMIGHNRSHPQPVNPVGMPPEL